MDLKIRYFKEDIPFHVDDSHHPIVLNPRKCPALESEAGEVVRALEHPIDSPRLKDIVKPGEKIIIVTSDISRPMPSWVALPCVLDELGKAGVRDEDVTVVFGLGSHRKQTEEEKKRLVGEEVYNRVRCIDSDPDDFIHMGTCKNGTSVDIFRTVAEADWRILVGNVEYHYFAGYSGGMKAIMPGVSSRAAIQSNHRNMIKEGAYAGNLEGNPVRDDIEEVYQYCPVDFILNVALDENHHIAYAAAGHHVKAHRKACEFLDSIYKIHIDHPADVVIVSTSGFPKDINLYQAQKSIDNAKHSVKEGGIMVVAAACKEGFGSDVFAKWIMQYDTPDDRIKAIHEHFELGGHKSAALALVEKKCNIYLVTDMEDDLVRKANMTPFHNLQEAVDAAFAKMGKDASCYIIPDGGSTLPMED